MHSIFARLNNGSSLLSSCLMALLAAISLSTFVFHTEPTGRISIDSIKVLEANTPRYHHRRQEAAFVRFNVTADFTPLFNWNTKQIFLYLEAEYTNSQGVKNEVVIWDRIVRRKEDAIINVNGKNKYTLREFSRYFKNAPEAHYSLKYNVMPYVGVLTYGKVTQTAKPIAFPKVQKAVS